MAHTNELITPFSEKQIIVYSVSIETWSRASVRFEVFITVRLDADAVGYRRGDRLGMLKNISDFDIISTLSLLSMHFVHLGRLL